MEFPDNFCLKIFHLTAYEVRFAVEAAFFFCPITNYITENEEQSLSA
jgi:hypothetical protein